MNFYRCSKTITLLNTLYHSMAISKAVHGEEVREVQEIYSDLKDQLKDIDLKRFCELWEIDYHEGQQGREDEKATLIRIANELPRLNDTLDVAHTYGDVFETFANFCSLVARMRSFSNASSNIKRVIEDL